MNSDNKFLSAGFGWIIIFFLWLPAAFGQTEHVVPEPVLNYSQHTDERLPHSRYIWEGDALPSRQKMFEKKGKNILVLSEQTPLPFTGLATGWSADGINLIPVHFQVEIRSRPMDGEWGPWMPAPGYLAPDDSPSDLFWATLYVTPDGLAHDEFEIRIQIPENTVITYLKITAADARFDGEANKKFFKKENEDTPEIIIREAWWGSLPPEELEPDYTPTQIDITHTLVHHTVTSNEPPDPEQVIRQVWDWHVNDNGWSDIGYNFLFDHLGNIYQGRYNPWLETTDVQGAHAGSANSRSAGLALLGQFEPGAQPQFDDPSALALDALVRIIAWRFTQKDIHPFDYEWLAVNSGGSQQLPVISGHRDVSATACPGGNLYSLLHQIREDVEYVHSEDDVIADLPFELGQNYPNPFQDQTSIPFVLEEQSDVQIDLYNVRGQKLRQIYSENGLGPGAYNVPFDPSGLSSGAYFYELAASGYRRMKLMVFIR